jgi:O-antigen/teichoic acid export membrane protein
MLAAIKRLGKETVIYGIGTLFGRYLNFLLLPFYSNVLSTKEYGIVASIYAQAALISVVYFCGMDSAYMRYASSREEGGEKRVFSAAYMTVLVFSLVMSFVFFLSRNVLLRRFALAEGQGRIVLLMMGILFFDAISSIPFARLRLYNLPAKFILIKLINIVVNLALNVVFVGRLKWSIEGVFLAGLVASFLTWLVLLPDILKNMEARLFSKLLGPLLKFALPLVPTRLALTIMQVIDRPILLALAGTMTVGVYEANYKLGMVMMLLFSIFHFAWQPFYLKNAARRDAKILFGKVFTLFLTIGSALLIVLSLFIENIVRISFFGKHLIGQDYWKGLSIVPIVLLSALFQGTYFIFLAGIQIEKKTHVLPVITGCAALANITFNFLLIPKFDILGAAWATLLSYMILAAGMFYFSQRFYRIQYEYGKLMSIGISLLVPLGGYFIAKPFIPGGLILLKIVALALYITILFLSRLVDWKMIREIRSA